MNKIGVIPLRRSLQAQLTVRRDRIVEERNAVGKLSIVEHFAMVLAERLTRLSLKFELVLVAGAQSMHGTYLVWCQSVAEQIDGRHLAAEKSVLDNNGDDLIASIKRMTMESTLSSSAVAPI